MKKVNEDLLAMIKLIANQMGYDMTPTKSDKPLITWTLLNETEQAQIEAKNVEELVKELKLTQDKLAEVNSQMNARKADLLLFLNKNKANKAVESVAAGYGSTLPGFIVEIESDQTAKMTQRIDFITDQIFKKSMEELSEGYGKKVEFTLRSGLQRFISKL